VRLVILVLCVARCFDGAMHVDHEEARSVFLDQLDAFLDVCGQLRDSDCVAASRCRGWTVGDVLVHVHLGLQEMLLGVVSRSDLAPDADAASYWLREVPSSDVDADALAGVRFVRLLGAAYRRPCGVVGHMRPTALGVATAVRSLAPGALQFQGHVLATGDFLATWAVELAVHQLDLGRELCIARPSTAAIDLTIATIESILGIGMPATWSPEFRILAGTGRVSLSEEQMSESGPVAGLLPALG